MMASLCTATLYYQFKVSSMGFRRYSLANNTASTRVMALYALHFITTDIIAKVDQGDEQALSTTIDIIAKVDQGDEQALSLPR